MSAPLAGRGPANPPGRRRLVYRVGSYEDFVREMLDRLILTLRTATDAGGDDDPERRVRLNLDDADHWLIGLARSWATVADVLAFYQERLIHEGYIRTAVEDRSVHDLARMVGYAPRPGVAGSTDLAVRVTNVEGLPREIELAKGLVVRSKPPPGAEPQVFETVEVLVARTELNQLPFAPQRRVLPPRVEAGTEALDLAGPAPGLAAGSPLLVTGRIEGTTLRAFRRLAGVETVPGDPPVTRVTWAGPLADTGTGAVVEDVAAFAFPRRSGLFGATAPPWSDLPPEAKREVQPLEGGVLLFDGSGWKTRNEGLPSGATVLSLAVDDRGNLFAGTLERGVFRSTDGGGTWEPANRGLQAAEVRALAGEGRGILYAGTAGGVFRSTDRGAVWEPANGADQYGGAGLLHWLGRILGRSSKRGGRLAQGTVRDLVVTRHGGNRILLAGTDGGIFRSTDAGRRWQPANRDLPGAPPEGGVADVVVEALALAAPGGPLYAGTDAGVFRSGDLGGSWEPLNRGLPATDPFRGLTTTRVLGLAVLADPRGGDRHQLLAATQRGLYRLDSRKERWVGLTLDAARGIDRPVPKVAVWEDRETYERRIFAATRDGLWESSDDGASWQPVTPFPGGSPSALAAAAPSDAGAAPALAATPFGRFGDEWPGFFLRDGCIDLDGVVDEVVPGSWVVLDPVADGSAAAGVHRVEAVRTVRRSDFGLTATVTRLEVDPDEGLAHFGLRDTRVWLVSRPLGLARRTVVEYGSAVAMLTTALAKVPPTRRVIVTGRTPHRVFQDVLEPEDPRSVLGELDWKLSKLDPTLRVRIRSWADGASGIDGGGLGDPAAPPPSSDPLVDLEMPAEDVVRVLDGWIGEEPGSDLAAGDGTAPRRWQTLPGAELSKALDALVRSRAGVLLRAEVEPKEVGASLAAGELAAALGDADQVEDGLFRLPPPPGETPGAEISLESLKVHGNVVAAVEGSTVTGEILGDGDATRPNQAFRLAQAPNFQRTPGGPATSVGVRVQGQAWHPVRRLLEQGAASRTFRLDVDHQGAATVVFGDGEWGARLPTGRDNVVASYRSGMTTRRAAPRGVSLLQNRPLGLDEAFNPLPTTPGAAAEDPERIRRLAPASVRTLDRVVSLSDYADFARRFPGVARARAWTLPGPSGPLVQLTVAAAGGRSMEPGDGLLGELFAALDARRSARFPLVVQSYRRVEVAVAAKIRVDPDFLWSDVRPRLVEVLEERFGFAASHFGGGISASAVVRAMQRVRGVTAVDLDALGWPGIEAESPETLPSGVARERRAGPPRVRDGRVEAAELVMVGAMDLQAEAAP